MGRLEGMKAIVTGSGGGMGGAIAVTYAREGADVVLNDRLPGLTDVYEQQVRALGRDVVSVHANVTRREEARRVVDAALQRWGRVDILANVVGGIKGPVDNPIWKISEEEWEFAMGLNLRGTFHCTQLVLPGMMERRYGKILNIASSSWAGEAMHAHYAAAKAGVVAVTRSAATQLGPYNINVNAIAPGGTNTRMTRQDEIAAERGRSAGSTVPLGRMNVAQDIADAALFLVSEEARNISGQLLTVAGGWNPSL
ncbi:MAG: SDR family NAD(P)-dependent oxidoreductase [Gammaproteobacteria bacterium]